MSGPTAEEPWPVRTVALKINDWINKLGQVWVEGQVTQLNPGRGNTSFFTLRDPVAEVSLNATCSRALATDLTEGSRVVVLGKPSYWMARGSLSLAVSEVRQVGVGELLARIERLRVLLQQEGLFDEGFFVSFGSSFAATGSFAGSFAGLDAFGGGSSLPADATL